MHLLQLVSELKREWHFILRISVEENVFNECYGNIYIEKNTNWTFINSTLNDLNYFESVYKIVYFWMDTMIAWFREYSKKLKGKSVVKAEMVNRS